MRIFLIPSTPVLVQCVITASCNAFISFHNPTKSGAFRIVARFGIRPNKLEEGSSTSLKTSVPPFGKVDDPDEWIRIVSNSLEQLSGKDLYHHINDESIQTPADVHKMERFALLTHGNQTDPIYNYFNEGALRTFLWSEDEVYSIPSRYSAPDGEMREERAKMLNEVLDERMRKVPETVRVNKNGEKFCIRNLIFWNLYNDDGVRVGQAALFDRDYIVPYDEDK